MGRLRGNEGAGVFLDVGERRGENVGKAVDKRRVGPSFGHEEIIEGREESGGTRACCYGETAAFTIRRLTREDASVGERPTDLLTRLSRGVHLEGHDGEAIGEARRSQKRHGFGEMSPATAVGQSGKRGLAQGKSEAGGDSLGDGLGVNRHGHSHDVEGGKFATQAFCEAGEGFGVDNWLGLHVASTRFDLRYEVPEDVCGRGGVLVERGADGHFGREGANTRDRLADAEGVHGVTFHFVVAE